MRLNRKLTSHCRRYEAIAKAAKSNHQSHGPISNRLSCGHLGADSAASVLCAQVRWIDHVVGKHGMARNFAGNAKRERTDARNADSGRMKRKRAGAVET